MGDEDHSALGHTRTRPMQYFYNIIIIIQKSEQLPYIENKYKFALFAYESATFGTIKLNSYFEASLYRC